MDFRPTSKVRYDIPACISRRLYNSVSSVGFQYKNTYIRYPDQNLPVRYLLARVKITPTENTNQIMPAYLGTDTIDGKLCDVYQYTFESTSAKEWIWREKSFPIRMETTTSGGTSIMEFRT